MKKRNTTAILAFLAASLFVFAACDKISIGEKEKTTATTTAPSTTAKEFVEFEEVLTDASGEAVTDEEGNTTMVIVTRPASPSEPATAAPEGEKIDVEIDASGVPKDSNLQKLVNDITAKNAICFDGTMPMDGQDMNVKMYVKGDKCSAEVNMSGMNVRIIYDETSAKMIMPTFGCYITMPIDEVGAMNTADLMSMVDDMISDDLQYVSTTSVKISGKTYICETYRDGVNTNKYYFDSNGNFKRIEVIDADGKAEVTEFNEFSANVPDSAFTIPSSYVEITEDNMSSFAGIFGGM